MKNKPVSVSTDQVAAFVELVRQGSLHRAAEFLHITEQGVRNRLLALEGRLGVQLYRKRRGPRRVTPISTDLRAMKLRASTAIASPTTIKRHNPCKSFFMRCF